MITCEKCGSENVLAGKKGFSVGKAVGGALLAGPLGLAAGAHGSKDIEITCVDCGHVKRKKIRRGKKVIKPGRTPPPPKQLSTSSSRGVQTGCGWVLGMFLVVWILMAVGASVANRGVA